MNFMKRNEQEINIQFVAEVEKHEILYNFYLPGYSRRELTEQAWQEVSDKVNIPLIDCKEKWRNLRTVFLRKLKPQTGSRGRKAYYLADAMKFCIPFIKTLGQHTSTAGVLPQSLTIDHPPQQTIKHELADETSENSDGFVEDLVHTSFSPTPTSPEMSVVQPEDESPTEHHHNQSKTNSKRSRSPLVGYPERKIEKMEANHYESMYLVRNNHDATNYRRRSRNIDKMDAVRMFFDSLTPELITFDDSQMALFKRGVFGVIDKINSDAIIKY